MADFSLIELKQNDELTDVVRKSNSNFKNLGYALKKKLQGAADSSSAEWKQAIADLTKDMNQKVSDLTTELGTAKAELETAKQTMEKMVPPKGTILLVPDNPNTMYPGTTWQVYHGVHQLAVGNGATTPQYFEPLDANKNSLMPASTSSSTSTTWYSSIWVQAWYRTA